MRLLKKSIRNLCLSERNGTYSRHQRSPSMSLRSHSSSLTTKSKCQCSSLNTRQECLSLSQSRRMALKERSSLAPNSKASNLRTHHLKRDKLSTWSRSGKCRTSTLSFKRPTILPPRSIIASSPSKRRSTLRRFMTTPPSLSK